MAQIVLGMVHTPLTRQQLFAHHPEGQQKIAEEAEETRGMMMTFTKSKILRGFPVKKGRLFMLLKLWPLGPINTRKARILLF